MDNLRYLWVYYSFRSFNAIFLFENSFFSVGRWVDTKVVFSHLGTQSHFGFYQLTFWSTQFDGEHKYLHSYRYWSKTNVQYSRIKPTKTEFKRTKQTKTQWMNLYVYKILNNILSFLSVVVVFGGTNAQTHFGFKHFETESSDKYYCRCDKQFIQLKNSVSICEYLSYYMERFDNILSLQIEYIKTDSVEFFCSFAEMFVPHFNCSIVFFRVIFADVHK